MHHEIPSSIMAGVIEALVAGVYFDGGMEACRRMVERMFSTRIEPTTHFDRTRNFKSQLQQLSQKSFGETPIYQVLDEKGPDHSKCFQISAVIGPQTFPSAWGTSKKEAEQRAACNALQEIQGEKARRLVTLSVGSLSVALMLRSLSRKPPLPEWIGHPDRRRERSGVCHKRRP